MAGTPEQQSRWLPGLASGQLMATLAIAESHEGWDPQEWDLHLDEDKLTGSKRHVPFATQADLVVVGLAEGGLAVVQANAQGLVVSAEDSMDRTRPLYLLDFTETPAEALAASMADSRRLRNAALILLAADAFGGASRCVELAVDYAKIREQFGVPIGQFQALKHQLVNMAVDIEPSRGLFWYAAHAFDHVPGDSEHYAALAKAHIADRYLQVARDTVEAHGGIGYTWECDVQVYLKRAIFDFAFMGRPQMLRARLSL